MKVGQTITFKTDANIGVFTPASGTWITDSTGTATIKLSSGPNVGSSVVTATTAQGTSASLSYANTTPGKAVASIQLLVSSGNLLADGSSTVDLTALVKDANNNTVSGQAVNFTTDSGAVTVTNGGVSDASGRATAVLSSGGDKSSRTINLVASVGSIKASAAVVVSGTKITIAGVNSVVLGSSTKLTIRLQDGAGKAIPGQSVTLGSSLGNTFTVNGAAATSATTDTSGQATVTYVATKAGVDAISASALNERGGLFLNVSNESFTLSAPAPQAGANFPANGTPEFNLNTPITLTATYLVNGVPQANKAVALTTTRGTLTAGSVMTDATGTATTTIQASTAGGATITAAYGPVSSQYQVEFVATTPDKIALQVEKSTVAPNGNTSITATVRDAKNNLVKNQTVSFNLSDTTGGTLSVAKGVTDSFGQTSTTYTAGSAASSKDSVVITAMVGAISSTAKLTVSGQSLFVRVGTGNLVEVPNTTQYALPYSVLVTDAAGNPVSGATVALNIVPTNFYKGFHFWNGTTWQAIGGTSVFQSQTAACPTGTFLVSSDTTTTPATLTCRQILPTTACASEDSLVDPANGVGANNGILEPGEDTNGNGVLDPGFVASTVTSVTTDATGSGFFKLTYSKDRAFWVRVALTARATVQGTEASATAAILLGGAALDYSNQQVAPPGATSPYGSGLSCSNTL
ncbi:hypothetical protein GCM10027296_38350 [Chitinimonas naiadis]